MFGSVPDSTPTFLPSNIQPPIPNIRGAQYKRANPFQRGGKAKRSGVIPAAALTKVSRSKQWQIQSWHYASFVYITWPSIVSRDALKCPPSSPPQRSQPAQSPSCAHCVPNPSWTPSSPFQPSSSCCQRSVPICTVSGRLHHRLAGCSPLKLSALVVRLVGLNILEYGSNAQDGLCAIHRLGLGQPGFVKNLLDNVADDLDSNLASFTPVDSNTLTLMTSHRVAFQVVSSICQVIR